jgi:8-oxo-dGTP diphosphatase
MDFQNEPVFGERVLGCPYVVRPSAYALVRNSEMLIAVVRTSSGHFLPGGGLERGEDPEQAMVRETFEECGLVVSVVGVVGRAVEIVYSAAERTCFEKHCTFGEARLQEATPRGEVGHELMWLTAPEAASRLSPGSHRWAVRQFVTTA